MAEHITISNPRRLVFFFDIFFSLLFKYIWIFFFVLFLSLFLSLFYLISSSTILSSSSYSSSSSSLSQFGSRSHLLLCSVLTGLVGFGIEWIFFDCCWLLGWLVGCIIYLMTDGSLDFFLPAISMPGVLNMIHEL